MGSGFRIQGLHARKHSPPFLLGLHICCHVYPFSVNSLVGTSNMFSVAALVIALRCGSCTSSLSLLSFACMRSCPRCIEPVQPVSLAAQESMLRRFAMQPEENGGPAYPSGRAFPWRDLTVKSGAHSPTSPNRSIISTSMRTLHTRELSISIRHPIHE
jgi:hypothetical protein